VLDDQGVSRWPERWSPERIAQRQLDLGPLEFARQMLCVARDDTASRFKREWINKAMERGRDAQTGHAIANMPPGCRTYTGVDQTVLFTILVSPDGSREVLEVLAGRWSGPEIVSRITDVHHRWQSIVVVENNAAQDFIVQFARATSAVPVRAFTTGRNKAHPEFGVESLAAEMASGKWIIPNTNGRAHPEVETWIQELLFYDPAAHTGDRVMASWFAREGARMGMQRVEQGRIDLMSR
jgi:hypothetical protein